MFLLTYSLSALTTAPTAAAADVATGPSDVRACTPHASLGQPRHDALHGAVIAQEQLLLTLPQLYLQLLLLCVEVAVERVPFVPHLIGEVDGTDLRSGTVWPSLGVFDTNQAKVLDSRQLATRWWVAQFG